MLSTVFGFLAGACAVLVLLAILLTLPALLVAARRPAISAAPAAGCAFAGFVWAMLALALAWMSSALAGQ